ncbi:hypothetical protein OD218_001699 [Salmonella enterica]|nr:hypothetical protein [Salmonella enterica]EHN6577898.1 hypothetical protein [Salmonella enterica subsp. enterica serovar Anecho]EHG4044829.1 hypothetical protein [Salmonella enterica]EJC0214924.1 hypothetical protein [Salmonella enterica]EJC0219790.1 hypothetical protein [Salmonella enterica]
MTKKQPGKNAPEEPDFSSVEFALDEYLKSRCNKRKVNRGSIGSGKLKPEEPQEPES